MNIAHSFSSPYYHKYYCYFRSYYENFDKRNEEAIKTVKIAIIFFTLVFASSVFAQSFKSGSEPNGFRNAKWGTELSTLRGMKYYKTSRAGGSSPVGQGGLPREFFLEIYSKIGDELRVEGVEVESIKYGFWKGKFCEVTITTKGFGDWVSLKKAIVGKFGEGKELKFCPTIDFVGIEENEYYIWLGKITEMELLYNENPPTRQLWMGSAELREKAFKEDEQKRRR
jgi:hypothetical protein